jgi:hypothetical protein
VRVLLSNPDNGVTRNFMPHLWMFLLSSTGFLEIRAAAQALPQAGAATFASFGTRSTAQCPHSTKRASRYVQHLLIGRALYHPKWETFKLAEFAGDVLALSLRYKLSLHKSFSYLEYG